MQINHKKDMKRIVVSFGGRGLGHTFLRKLFNMEKPQHTGSFNLQNASSQDLHTMIQSGNLPSFLNSFQRNRIIELYKSGDTFGAVRKLQGLIEQQNTKPGKSLL